MTSRARALSLVAAALMVAGPLALAADAASSYNANSDEAGVASLQADWLCGSGVSGAKIHLGGTAKFRNIGMSVRFEATGNRSQVAYADAADGVELTIDKGFDAPKSPRAGGAGGNPYIFFLAKDRGGKQMGEPVLLGRCNGASSGSSRVQARVMAGIASLASVGATGCNNGSSSITASRRHSKGINGAIVLSNKIDLSGFVTDSQDVAVTDFSMGDFGAEKRGDSSVGVGGNPTLSLLMWKARSGDDSRPNVDANGVATYTDGASADVFSVSNDLTGAKGWRTLGRCTDLKK